MLQEKLKNILEKSWGLEEVNLEIPVDNAHGDYSTNIAMAMFAKSQEPSIKSQTNPEFIISNYKTARELADAIVTALLDNSEISKLVQKVEVAGPGFINFYLKDEMLSENLEEKFDEYREVLGHEELKELRVVGDLDGKKIMIEYAHPNTHKEMHIGHMRTLIAGEALARLKYAAGASVFRANYQGDIGPHVAKAVWGVKRLMAERGKSWKVMDNLDLVEKAKFLGEAYALGNKYYEDKKDDIDTINSDLYEGKGDYFELYEKTRVWSLEYFESIYHRFHTYFDKLYFESEAWESGKNIVQENTPGVFSESDGAIVYKGEDKGLHTRVFITSAGNTTYEGKEMGLAFMQYSDFDFDQNIHVVANEQTGYFKVVFAALSEIDANIGERELHIPMGFVNLKGGKMSSRTGEVFTVTDLVETVKDASYYQINNDDLTEHARGHVAEAVAIGAIKYSILRTGLEQDVAFDVKTSVDMQGDSGPYIQYTYARTQSVLRIYQGENAEVGIDKSEFSFDAGDSQHQKLLLRKLIHFEDVVSKAANNNAPNLMCTYLYELAQLYNSFYGSEKIIGSDTEKFRLALNYVVGEVLRHGLYLLGIDAPERM